MDTRKLIIVTVIAVVVLNLLSEAMDKEQTKKIQQIVLDTLKNNPESGGPQAPPQEAQAPPSPEEEFKRQLADRVQVDIGNTPVLGNKDAKIMLVVFSDFQCPFSKRGHDTTKALISKYGRDISYVYKNLPLSFHPQADPAARAAYAAAKQGKYYEYHDKLFEYQNELGEDLYIRIAKELGLNIDKFNRDRNSEEVAQLVKNDAEQASRLGFNGTPGFALNGVKILGAYPQEHFEKVIEALGQG